MPPRRQGAAPAREERSVSRRKTSDPCFHILREETQHQPKVAVITIMDISGTMNTMRKRFERSFFFLEALVGTHYSEPF